MTRRVLAVHPKPDLYGADLMLLEALRALRENGDDVVAAFPEHGPLLPLVEQLGVEVRVLPFPVLRKSLLSARGLATLLATSTAAFRRLRAVLRTVQPDLVYVNTVTVPLWLLAARSLRLPAVCHVHEAEEHVARPIVWGLLAPLRVAGTVLANSESTARHIARHHPGVGDRITVVLNGFELPERAAPPPPRTRRRLVVVGRLSPRKGQDVAVEALAQLTVEGYDLEMELVGSAFPGYEWFVDRLRARAAELGVADQVIFSGYQTSGWKAFVDGDIALIPSRVEPFGMVAVEAMAVGRPVVATDVGGLAEVLRAGETALLCPPDDAPGLAGTVRRLLDEPDLAAQLVAAAALDVRGRFGRERFSADFHKALAGAAREPAG